MSVIHLPRVAWEGARVFVTAADADAYWWLSEMVGRHLGVMYELDLAGTRRRLQTEDATFAEMGAWRTRLEDLLNLRPDLASLMIQLIDETSARLRR